jgi:N-methylhydantoinase B
MSGPDPFTLEIVRSHFIATVREMADTTKRTAYSTVISEALDFTCGLFAADARMIAQAEGIPLHAGSLPLGVRAILDAFDDIAPADVFIASDPYVLGLHQADVMVARPIFVDDELFAFAANRAHWVDVGGMAAGGWSGTATHVVQEGLRIPPVRMIRAGKVDEHLKALILANVRLPVADWGDFQAQVASTTVAERRLLALVDRYGRETVEAGMRFALEYSRTRFARALQSLPAGSWEAEEVFEEDGRGGGPHFIRVTVTKDDDGITVDFSESDPQVSAPINCSAGSTYAAAYVALIATLDPAIPLNSGLIELVQVKTKPGTLAHAVFPAPVFFSSADPSIKACEVIFKALASVLPDRVVAGTLQTANNITGSGVRANGEPFQWYSVLPGGLGARPEADGDSGEWHVMCNCKNESVEIWEQRYPVRIEEFSLVCDSAGRGRFRGGLGLRKSFRVLERTELSSIADRHVIGPWGLGGGESGKPNRYLVDGDRGVEPIKDHFGISSGSKFSSLPLEPGEILIVESAGGGGHGPAEERDPALLDRDLEFEYTGTDAPAEPLREAPPTIGPRSEVA